MTTGGEVISMVELLSNAQTADLPVAITFGGGNGYVAGLIIPEFLVGETVGITKYHWSDEHSSFVANPDDAPTFVRVDSIHSLTYPEG